MPEPALERTGSPEDKGKQEVAHGWVATLTERMVACGGEGISHVECTLDTNQESIADVLQVMRVGDLLLAPGDRAGELQYAEFPDGHGGYENNLGLWHGGSFIIPPEPTRIFLSALSRPAKGDELGIHYLGVGLEYDRGSRLYRQVVGLVAEPDHTVAAIRLLHGQLGGKAIIEEEYTRPHGIIETREFVACMEDIFAFSRHKL